MTTPDIRDRRRALPLEPSRLLKCYKSAARPPESATCAWSRHTLGTRMALAGVPMRTLQEWIGHRDYKTTLSYADYSPIAHEREFVELAFGTTDATIGVSEEAANTAERR